MSFAKTSQLKLKKKQLLNLKLIILTISNWQHLKKRVALIS